MTGAAARIRRIAAIVVVTAAFTTACASPSGRAARAEPLAPPEVRATWVVGNALTDAAEVRRVVDEARTLHLNALIVQARARGDAIFASRLEPQAAHLEGRPDDLLAACLRGAGPSIAVHAWVNACLVANADALSHDPRHVTVAHPEWLMVPEELAAELWHRPPADPAYRETLARYALDRKGEVEGLFCDPALPEYRAHVVAVVADLCQRYRLAGIHLDYIRYPGVKWGCSRAALDLFRVEIDRELNASERADMAQRVARDPLTYARRYPARFAEFRRNGVSRLVEEVARVCRARGVLLSAATFPDIGAARDRYFQEWPAWLARGDLDVACPMIYTTDAGTFEEQARAAVHARGRGSIWAGIGAWRLDAHEMARRVDVARAAGASGVVLFSHHGARAVAGAHAALRAGPFALKARPPVTQP